MGRRRYLIIGNGAAGATAAEEIRSLDRTGQITMLSAERYPMYSRPGLAYVLTDEVPPEQIIARPREWYDLQRIDLVFGRAVAIDTERQEVGLENGRLLPYDRLLIATGARARAAPYDGADLEGVVYLDTMDGAKGLLRQARRARRAVVIGGGITAMEMVEGLTHQGVETHYFLRRDRLWSRVFNDQEAAVLEAAIREHGATIHYHTEVSAIIPDRRDRRVAGVRLKNGDAFSCDLLGVAIGVIPQIDLVADTPIETDRAILVNEQMRTNVPGVYAAGDCAQVYDRWSGQHLLDILWPSAVAEGRAAGRNMAGRPVAYQKGTPFNVCLLFGLHVTAIGQVNPRHEGAQAVTPAEGLSRGSSEVWYTFPRNYRSAWAEEGPNTLRLALDGRRLVGALIIGEQSLADPLRELVEAEVDATPLLPYLEADRATLREKIMRLWGAEGNV